MVPEVFYQTVAQLAFTLLGLWWLVLQTKYNEWIHSQTRRRMATNITLYFLLPGSMSLLALLATTSRLLWQVAFVLAALIGAVATAFFLRAAHASQWRNPWSLRIVSRLKPGAGALCAGDRRRAAARSLPRDGDDAADRGRSRRHVAGDRRRDPRLDVFHRAVRVGEGIDATRNSR
jgi:hypothetical protein